MSAITLGLSALAFCTWCIYLGGLASLQAVCDRLPGPPDCKNEYRFQWFVMSIEFVVVVALMAAAVTNRLKSCRMAFLGLMAVNMLLYINVSDYFFQMQDMTRDTQNRWPRVQTALAGAISTATVNGFLVIALGMKDSSEEAPEFTGQPTTMVEKAPAEAA